MKAILERGQTASFIASSNWFSHSIVQSTPTMKRMPSDSQRPVGPRGWRASLEHSRLLKNGAAAHASHARIALEVATPVLRKSEDAKS